MDPTLTDEELRGVGEPSSKRAKAAYKDYDAAKEALQQVNIEDLFVLYEKAVRSHTKMEKLFFDVAEAHLQRGDGTGPPLIQQQESETVVSSMERIALAAIESAKLVTSVENDKG